MFSGMPTKRIMYSFFSASFGSQNVRPSLCTWFKQRKFIRNESTGGSLAVLPVVHNYFRLVYIVIQSSGIFIVSFFFGIPFSPLSSTIENVFHALCDTFMEWN